jgi:hypothetical protein
MEGNDSPNENTKCNNLEGSAKDDSSNLSFSSEVKEGSASAAATRNQGSPITFYNVHFDLFCILVEMKRCLCIGK